MQTAARLETARARPPRDDADEAREPRDTTSLLVAVAAAAVAAPCYWAVHFNLGDDAYITLGYAKNVAFHGTWGVLPGVSANTASSPLNVLLVAAATFVTRRPLLALGIVFVASTAVIGWSLARTARRLELPLAAAVLPVALILANPYVLSSTGLESMLFAATLAALLCFAVEGRALPFGVAAGLAVLTRLEAVVFVVPLVLSSPPLRRSAARVAGTAALVTLPWFLPRWIIAGSAIPDTFVVKTLQKSFGDMTFANGPFRAMEQIRSKAWVSFAPVLAAGLALAGGALFVGARDRRIDARFLPVAGLALGAVAYYGAYAAIQVPPYHWYYSPILAGASIVLGLALGAVAARLRRRAWAAAVFVPIVVLLGAQAVVVVRHGLPWRRDPVVFGNWAQPVYYRTVGGLLRERVGDALVQSPGEVGTLAFYCECNIVDMLSDGRFTVPPINERIDQAGPVVRRLLEWNYRNLDRDQEPPRPAYRLEWRRLWVAEPDAYLVWSPPYGFTHFKLVPQ
jgi:hypothetical protein